MNNRKKAGYVVNAMMRDLQHQKDVDKYRAMARKALNTEPSEADIQALKDAFPLEVEEIDEVMNESDNNFKTA